MSAKNVPKVERVIALWAGESGTGKSFAVGCLPRALIFDTDIGGGLTYLDARIRRNGSERIEVGSYQDVKLELQKRRNQLKQFTTIAIDHLSTLHQESVLRHNPGMADNTYGREYDKATKEWRQIREFARHGDFNLICTAHLKSKYEGNKAVGVTADAAKNIAADFMIFLRLDSAGENKYPSNARVIKWRRDPEDPRGLVPPSFPFTVEDFLRIHGSPIDAPRREVELATPAQVAEITALVQILKLPDGMLEKWFSKAKAEAWNDFTQPAIAACIDYCKKLMDNPEPVTPTETQQ